MDQQIELMTEKAVAALEEIKAKDIMVLDTTKLSSAFSKLIVATGDSNRQVKALARNVEDALKKSGFEILGLEGMESGDWVLVDAADILVHVMLPAVRDYYDIEALWGGQKPSLAIDKPWDPVKPTV